MTIDDIQGRFWYNLKSFSDNSLPDNMENMNLFKESTSKLNMQYVTERWFEYQTHIMYNTSTTQYEMKM